MATNNTQQVLRVKDMNFIPFRSQFQQQSGGADRSSGYVPSTSVSYNFDQAISLHNPYVRPHFGFHAVNLIAGASNIVSNFMTTEIGSGTIPSVFNFAEFTTISGQQPTEVLASAFEVQMIVRNKSQENFNIQYLKFRIACACKTNSFGSDYSFALETLTQGKIIDTNNRIHDMDIQIQLETVDSDDPITSVRAIIQNPSGTTLNNQQILTKGLITYIG